MPALNRPSIAVTASIILTRLVRIGPSGGWKLGPKLKSAGGGDQHHSDVGSRSADPIKLCVKSGPVLI